MPKRLIQFFRLRLGLLVLLPLFITAPLLAKEKVIVLRPGGRFQLKAPVVIKAGNTSRRIGATRKEWDVTKVRVHRGPKRITDEVRTSITGSKAIYFYASPKLDPGELKTTITIEIRTYRYEEIAMRDATGKIVEIVRSLERDYDTVWGSMVKQTIRRVFPGYNEEYFGHQSFAEALEAAEQSGAIALDYDEKRGNYVVRTKRT